LGNRSWGNVLSISRGRKRLPCQDNRKKKVSLHREHFGTLWEKEFLSWDRGEMTGSDLIKNGNWRKKSNGGGGPRKQPRKVESLIFAHLQRNRESGFAFQRGSVCDPFASVKKKEKTFSEMAGAITCRKDSQNEKRSLYCLPYKNGKGKR